MQDDDLARKLQAPKPLDKQMRALANKISQTEKALEKQKGVATATEEKLQAMQ